jgi:hypothetical protein
MKHIANILLAAAATYSSTAFAGAFHESISHPENRSLAPFKHLHFSELGTPVIHSFGVEPGFTGRDLFLDHTYRKGDGFSEHETELELEWAFTRRLGVIVEVPHIWEEEEGVGSASGFGDLAIVPRAILIESPRLILTAQVETVLPTASRGFGGDTAIAPGIALWNDLGNWFTLNTNIAVEHGFDEDSTELLFGFGLVKSYGEKSTNIGHDHDDFEQHQETSAGLLHLHLEVIGSTPLNGEDKGDFYAEGLVGVSCGILPEMDIRLGYKFPITSPHEFDHGLTGGLIFHF